MAVMPRFLVSKSDDETRSLPLPNIQDYTTLVSGCTVSSHTDLVKEYHQILVEPTDVP